MVDKKAFSYAVGL